MDINTYAVEALKVFAQIFGSYGLAIIVFTIIVRLLMWPLNVSQQRSMKTMQSLQPKLKLIQERYKSDPQKMQQKMMEFYKENKFNPFAGCLPMLIQLPIFIVLYSALMSPQFIQAAGDAKFLFINRLDSTLRGTAGISNDGQFTVSGHDMFVTGKMAKVYLVNEKGEENVIENVKIQSPKSAVKVQGGIQPGEPIDFKMSTDEINLKHSQIPQIKKAELSITNPSTRETEKIMMNVSNTNLIASVPTLKTETKVHVDVLILVALFGLTMFLSTKVMSMTNKSNQQDAMQQAMQKSMSTIMPVMLMATFLFIPIPAGVLLYLVASNIIMVIQTVIINKQLDKEAQDKKVEVIVD